MVRRVVTGVCDGASTVVADDKLELDHPEALRGIGLLNLWGWDETPASPASGMVPPFNAYFPGEQGVRFELVEFPPEAERPAGPVSEAADRDLRKRRPGLNEAMDQEGSDWHRTDTVDFGLVISGSVSLCLDEGEFVLNSGACVVQNATRHAWRNRGTEPCLIAFVMFGVRPKEMRANQ